MREFFTIQRCLDALETTFLLAKQLVHKPTLCTRRDDASNPSPAASLASSLRRHTGNRGYSVPKPGRTSRKLPTFWKVAGLRNRQFPVTVYRKSKSPAVS